MPTPIDTPNLSASVALTDVPRSLSQSSSSSDLSSSLSNSLSSSSESDSESRSASPFSRQDGVRNSPCLTFFDSPFLRVNRRADTIKVVNIDNYRIATIHCDDDEVLDLLCRIIPCADSHAMRILASVQTLQLQALRFERSELEMRHRRVQQLTSAVEQDLHEQRETEEFELLSLFCQLDDEQGDDTALEDEYSENASSYHPLSADDSELSEDLSERDLNDFDEEEQGNGYSSSISCRM